MSKTLRNYVLDMLHYIGRIEATTAQGKTAFLGSWMMQDAVIRQYEVVGEIAKRLPPELLITQPAVDWRALKGFRDYLAHNYDKVEAQIIWDAVEKLPILKAAAEALLAGLPDEGAATTEGDDA
jgi:uncharacterized protein with HEPN domain